MYCVCLFRRAANINPWRKVEGMRVWSFSWGQKKACIRRRYVMDFLRRLCLLVSCFGAIYVQNVCSAKAKWDAKSPFRHFLAPLLLHLLGSFVHFWYQNPLFGHPSVWKRIPQTTDGANWVVHCCFGGFFFDSVPSSFGILRRNPKTLDTRWWKARSGKRNDWKSTEQTYNEPRWRFKKWKRRGEQNRFGGRKSFFFFGDPTEKWNFGVQ